MRSKQKHQQHSTKPNVTWASATRDIVLRLIATGQLPIGIFGGAVLLLIYKTPSSETKEVWAFLHSFVEARSGLGYVLFVGSLAGWFFHSRMQRRNAESELRRLAEQRTREQQKYFKAPLPSSED